MGNTDVSFVIPFAWESVYLTRLRTILYFAHSTVKSLNGIADFKNF